MKKKMSKIKKIGVILWKVLIGLISIRYPEAEKVVDKKINEIEKTLNYDHRPKRRNPQQKQGGEQNPHVGTLFADTMEVPKM